MARHCYRHFSPAGSQRTPDSRTASFKDIHEKSNETLQETPDQQLIQIVVVLEAHFNFQEKASVRAAESVAAPLRAEQGPCEPSEDVVRKFREQ